MPTRGTVTCRGFFVNGSTTIMRKQSVVESPCTGVCTLDDQGVCAGCGRLMDEIVRWSAASVSEQHDIRERAARRRRPRDGNDDLSISSEPNLP